VPSRSVLLVAPTTQLWPDLGVHLMTLPHVRVVGEAADPCQVALAARTFQADLLLTVTRPALYACSHRHMHCPAATAAPPLADREQRVLLRLAQGLREREIANAEGLSLRTVERTVAGLVAALDAPSRVGLVATAALRGLLTADDLVVDEATT